MNSVKAYVVTLVTACSVRNISSWVAEFLSNGREHSKTSCRCKLVSRVVTMLSILEARHTNIVILAVSASNECVFRKD